MGIKRKPQNNDRKSVNKLIRESSDWKTSWGSIYYYVQCFLYLEYPQECVCVCVALMKLKPICGRTYQQVHTLQFWSVYLDMCDDDNEASTTKYQATITTITTTTTTTIFIFIFRSQVCSRIWKQSDATIMAFFHAHFFHPNVVACIFFVSSHFSVVSIIFFIVWIYTSTLQCVCKTLSLARYQKAKGTCANSNRCESLACNEKKIAL